LRNGLFAGKDDALVLSLEYWPYNLDTPLFCIGSVFAKHMRINNDRIHLLIQQGIIGIFDRRKLVYLSVESATGPIYILAHHDYEAE
jgi:hypothetical protein